MPSLSWLILAQVSDSGPSWPSYFSFYSDLPLYAVGADLNQFGLLSTVLNCAGFVDTFKQDFKVLLYALPQPEDLCPPKTADW